MVGHEMGGGLTAVHHYEEITTEKHDVYREVAADTDGISVRAIAKAGEMIPGVTPTQDVREGHVAVAVVALTSSDPREAMLPFHQRVEQVEAQRAAQQ